jgi:UDP-N-acetylenolpyruvoylglucosamine reductase
MKDLLYKYNKGKITEKEFDKVLPEIRKHFAKVRFEGDIEKTTESEKIILLRMARLRKEEVSPLDVKAAGSLFERLVKKDLIIKVGRGKYKLYHSLFKEYLKTLKS